MDEPTRYRCTHCGNVTRFDVTRRRRTKAYHHYTVGGELEVEDTEVLDDAVEEVACRWCESAAHVEEVDEGTAADAGSDEHGHAAGASTR